MLNSVLVALLLTLAFPPTVLAYVDPGVGSFMLQGILAVVAGGWAVFRFKSAQIKRMIGLGRDAEAQDKAPAE